MQRAYNGNIEKLIALPHRSPVTLRGWITSVGVAVSRRGKRVIRAELRDASGKLSVAVSVRSRKTLESLRTAGVVAVVTGWIDKRNGTAIVADNILVDPGPKMTLGTARQLVSDIADTSDTDSSEKLAA